MIYKFICEAFLILNVMVTTELKKIKSKNEKHQVEIIKNISLANQALQELINNYEQLKKIYRSGEIFQSYSSLSESNEYFRVMADNSRNRSYQKFGDITASKLQPATVGIYESQLNYDNVDSKELSKESAGQVEPTINVTKNVNKESEVNMKKPKQSSDEDSSESFESEDIDAIPIEIPEKHDIIIFKQNTSTNTNEKTVMTMKTTKINQNILGEKTRFSVQRFGHKNESDEHLLEILNTNSRRVKRVVYSETFSPNNIWQEIISKPMQLMKDTDKSPKINDNPQFRDNYNNKMTLVILTKDVMKDKDTLNGLIFDSMSEEQILYRSKFQDTHLRSHYGDTCLHIPIKKCKKAVNEVSRKVCKARFKCKSEFKSDFVKNGQIGCKKTFLYGITDNDEKREKELHKYDKIPPPIINKRDSFVNASNKFYGIRYHDKKTDTNTITLRNETPYYVNPIVLRNKYERECRKEARSKCVRACEYGTEETCAEHTCSKKKEEALMRSCKSECNKLFIVKKERSSSSGDSSDSDSKSSSRSRKRDKSDRS